MSVMQTDKEVKELEILVHEVEDSEETDEYEIDLQESEKSIKMIETLNAISTLRKYVTQSDGMDSCHGLLDKIESDIHNYPIKNLKQMKMTRGRYDRTPARLSKFVIRSKINEILFGTTNFFQKF
jgi:hypothetical protein